MRLNEVGATYNKDNLKLLKDAYKALKTAIANFVDPETEDTADKSSTSDTAAKEASGFSNNDLVTVLQAELADVNANARICDIFPDDKTLIYMIGWYMGDCYQVSYTLDDTGVATFGTPVEVSRKVTYVPKSDAADSTDTIADQGSPMAMADEALIISDPINLIESAVQADGTVMLKLISPGWGSSGYYSREVLQRDGPKIFTEGLHNFIDHPTPEEERLRPEGSLTKLGSTLTEDAKWLDDFKGYGPGLYAKAKVNPEFASTLNTIAPFIGTSIRAGGKVSQGVAEGRSGPIVEQLTVGKSVDYVTRAGAGGKVLTLLESARSKLANDDKGDQDMGHSEEIARLSEANTALQQRVARLLEDQRHDQAKLLINQQLSQYPTLLASTRQRLVANVLNAQLPITEAGTLDTAKLSEAVKAAVDTEVKYLAELGVGSVRGLGNSQPVNLAEIDVDKEWADLDKIF